MSNIVTPRDRSFVLVVALDLGDSASGGYALDQALRIARRIPGSQAHAVHVGADDAKPETLGLLRHYVEAKALALGGCERQSVAVHVRKGEPGHEIAQLASDLGADLIVVGTHKALHLKTLLVGSTAGHVMTTAPCPVVVAGPRPPPENSHVITIEPPCPDCVKARVETHGKSWWCARHSEHHPVLTHHHLYSYHTELPFAEHDEEVSATGVD
jgi:nucleotide-binding universal stress UspA family protein